ncbi:hypothetical protein NH340_JMT07269 [Sarcoptes scabiei]|nr:hypothetical protein NH340_JMT07269 [Sarcoptes scabiei]
MVYINSRGEILEKEPFTWRTPWKFLLKLIWSLINFFLTMFGFSDQKSSSIRRYFLGSNGYSNDGNDDHHSGPGGGGRNGGSGGGGGPRFRTIGSLPRNSPIGMSTCPGGSCGR